MPRLFAAAYLAPQRRSFPNTDHPTLAAFRTACAESPFPFDIGDDPSFFASRHLRGPLTWGVCRPDVRAAVRPDDIVVFFAAARANVHIRYLFVGAFFVEQKISHATLWSGEYPFRQYLNLLIRPVASGWEHFEPGLEERDWHEDWLWRIAMNRGVRKHVVLRASRSLTLGQPLPYPFADSYVVFSISRSITPAKPLPVATYSNGEGVETWRSDPHVLALRRLIYEEAKRGIRTHNRQQPHRHFRRTVHDPNDFRVRLTTILGGTSDGAG